jgi:nucleotide-binding universal stress UspA family protein
MDKYFKNILIPTDFSLAAENAVTHGLALASKTKANVFFLHAYHFPILRGINGENIYLDEQSNQEALKAANKQLLETQKKAVVLHPELHIENINEQGFLSDVITSVCNQRHIDLIVMGTKGASGLDEYLIGSNTAIVLDSVSCPVLIVPKNANFKPYKKILFATDFQFDDVGALFKLIPIAELFGASLEVLHISHNAKEDADLMDWFQQICEERSPNKTLLFSNIVRNESTLKALNKLIQAKEIDLVAMTSTNKGFLKRLFTGSMTEKMAYHSEIPFLAFHVRENNRL